MLVLPAGLGDIWRKEGCVDRKQNKTKNDAIIVYLGNKENLRFKNTNLINNI